MTIPWQWETDFGRLCGRVLYPGTKIQTSCTTTYFLCIRMRWHTCGNALETWQLQDFWDIDLRFPRNQWNGGNLQVLNIILLVVFSSLGWYTWWIFLQMLTSCSLLFRRFVGYYTIILHIPRRRKQRVRRTLENFDLGWYIQCWRSKIRFKALMSNMSQDWLTIIDLILFLDLTVSVDAIQ